MPNTEPMPAPGLDALEALREAYERTLDTNPVGYNAALLANEAIEDAFGPYATALVNAAPTLIAQARKDAEEIAALREGLRLADIMALRCLEACDGLMYDTPEDEAAILAVEAYNFKRTAANHKEATTDAD